MKVWLPSWNQLYCWYFPSRNKLCIPDVYFITSCCSPHICTSQQKSSTECLIWCRSGCVRILPFDSFRGLCPSTVSQLCTLSTLVIQANQSPHLMYLRLRSPIRNSFMNNNHISGSWSHASAVTYNISYFPLQNHSAITKYQWWIKCKRTKKKTPPHIEIWTQMTSEEILLERFFLKQ